MKTSVALLLCVFAGVIDFLGFVGFGIFPLAWVAWVPVLLATRGTTPKRAFAYGMVFGTIAHIGGYYWVSTMLVQFGGLSAPLGYLGLLLLCSYQGIMFAILLVLIRIAERDLGWKPIWTMAVAYPAVEWAFPLLFPYYIGNSQYRFVAITQIVEVTGMLGLTVLIAMLNGAFYELLEARLDKRPIDRRAIGAAAALFAVFAIYGLVRLSMIDGQIESARKIEVAMIQTNLGARDKADKRDQFIKRHLEMSRAAVVAHPQVDLIVWPETAYNTRISRDEKNVYARVGEGINKPMIFGVLTQKDKDVYNTAVLTSSTGDIIGRFDKVELLAFGETVPFSKTFPSIKKLFKRSSTFARGETFENMQLGETSFQPNICYEDILPAFVRRMWNTAGAADVLVNITNDSWYGDSHEPWIHLVLATFRSIETRRALIRSTNTGVSAFVDPAGRIVAHTEQWKQETLVGEVPLIEHGGSTIYMLTGDWVGQVAFVLVVLGLIRARKNRRAKVTAPAPRASR